MGSTTKYFSLDLYPLYPNEYEVEPGGESSIVMEETYNDHFPYAGVNPAKTGCGNLAGLFLANCTFSSKSIAEERLDAPREFAVRVIIGVVLTLIILATIIGNVFVLAAICMQRNLHSVANYLILSLAVADLMVACLVMPLGAVYEVSETWMLGEWMCITWTSSDVLSCTASILHLVAIAMDRYWAVTDIHYIHKRSSNRIGTMIGVIWTLSILVSLSQLGWTDAKWQENIAHHQCVVNQELGYQIFATLSSFYVPLGVILFLYQRIYQAARKRIRRRPSPVNKLASRLVVEASFTQNSSSDHTPEKIFLKNITNSEMLNNNNLSTNPPATLGKGLTSSTKPQSNTDTKENGGTDSPVFCSVESEGQTCSATIRLISPGSSNHSIRISRCSPYYAPAKREKTSKESRESKRERKAAKTLAVITGAFIVCWLPFFVMALIASSCENCNISKNVMTFTLWLGYFNSTLNPCQEFSLLCINWFILVFLISERYCKFVLLCLCGASLLKHVYALVLCSARFLVVLLAG